jgi:hypothetical protein
VHHGGSEYNWNGARGINTELAFGVVGTEPGGKRGLYSEGVLVAGTGDNNIYK